MRRNKQFLRLFFEEVRKGPMVWVHVLELVSSCGFSMIRAIAGVLLEKRDTCLMVENLGSPTLNTFRSIC